MSRQTTGVGRKQPWLGLTSYQETDSGLFFGREREGDELLRLVRREVLTVLFGPSGTGKTSLLNAGLFPLLRESSYLPISIRLDHSRGHPDYVGQVRLLIAKALQGNGTRQIEEEALTPPQVPTDRETLWEYLHRVVFWDRRNNPVTPVLVFDQFEEIFTLGRNQAASEEFLAMLADLVENYIPAAVRSRMETGSGLLPFRCDQPKSKIVLSLREDFVWRLDGLRKLMPSVMHNRFTIARMNGEQALRAVREPGKGIVEDPVAQQIVRFVAANQARATADDEDVRLDRLQVDPALLSVVCRELNVRRLGENKERITGELVEQAATNILNDFYERSFEGLNPAVRVFVEDRLLTGSGFRSTVPLEEAARSGIGEENIRTLVDRRVIRVEERLGIPHLELTHDLLTNVVQRSRNERQEREHRERENERIEAEARGRAEQEKRRLTELRRTRRLLAVMVGAAGVFLLLSLLAFIMYRKARDATVVADHQRKYAEMANETTKIALDDAKKQEKIANSARQQVELAAATERAARAVDLAGQPGREMEALAAAVKAMGQTLEHPGRIPSAALTEGLAVAVAAAEFSIPLGGPTSSAAFSRSGKRLLTSTGFEATLWDPSEGRRIAVFPLANSSYVADVSALSFSCDDREVVTVRNQRDSLGAQIWDAERGAPLRTLSGHTQDVHSAFFSPDSTRVVTASRDGTIRIWDVRAGRTIRELKREPGQTWGSVDLAVFSPDGSRILTVHQDNHYRVWDAATGELLETKDGNQGVASAAFSNDSSSYRIGRHVIATPTPESPCLVRADDVSPDGKLIAVADSRRPGLRNAKTNEEVKPVYGHFGEEADAHEVEVSYVGFSPDGNFILSADANSTARVWNARTGEPVRLLKAPRSALRMPFATVASDNRTVVTTGDAPRRWNTRVDRSLLTLGQQINNLSWIDSEHSVNCAVFSPHGATAITGHAEGWVRVWNVATGAMLSSVQAAGSVNQAGFSSDGSHVIAVTKERVELFDARTTARIAALEAKTADTSSLSHGNRLLIVNRSGWQVVDATTGKVLRQGQAYEPSDAALSPDGQLAALFEAYGNSVSLVNIGDGNSINLVHTGDYKNFAAFSPDGRQVVTRSARIPENGAYSIIEVDAHDTRTGKVVQTFRGHTGRVSSASYSPDGTRLVTASEDRSARIWEVASGALLATLEHAESIRSATFSPNGSQVLTLSADNQVWLWDASSGHRLATLSGHAGRVTSVAFSRDGRRVITASADGSAKIYSAAVGELLTEYFTAAFRLLRQQPRQYEETRSLEPFVTPYLRSIK
jgi:WD40 repeat protein